MAHAKLNIGDITAALDEAALPYQDLGSDVVGLGFSEMDVYRDPDGQAKAGVIVDAGSDRLKLFMPGAWRVPAGDNRAAVLETCLRLQWRYFGIRFEFDHRDGELRAAHDFLPCATPAASQVPLLILAFMRVVEKVHPAIDAAISDGVVYEPNTAATSTPEVNELMALLGSLRPEQMRELIETFREAVSE